MRAVAHHLAHSIPVLLQKRIVGLCVAILTVTLQATAAFSLEHWNHDRQESGRQLLAAAASWLGAEVTAFQVQGWRYSKPLRVAERPCRIVSTSPPLVLASDAFAGPRVEGAVLSGWAAAEALSECCYGSMASQE